MDCANRWRQAAVGFFLLASTVMAPSHAADAVPAGQALIYVVARDTGGFRSLLVSVNGQGVGNVARNAYVAVAVEPGTHEISSAAAKRGSTSLAVTAGNRYYVELRVNPARTPEFQILAEGDGLAALAQSQKVGSTDVAAPAVRATPAAPVNAARAPSRDNANDYRRGEPSASPRRRYDEAENALGIVIKSGDYTLDERAQVQDGIATVAETNSDSVIGVEVEWRHRSGLAVGGEFFLFENTWRSVGAGTFTGKLETGVYTVNGKYYFNIADIVFPYAGIGVGYAITSVSGDVEGNSVGFAYQGLAGVEFRFKYVGLHLQYKKLVADVEAENSASVVETNTIDGSGGLFGVAIHIPL